MSVQVIAPAVAGEPAGRRVCASPVAVTPRRRGRGHFSAGHPLASVARTRCEQVHAVPISARIGRVACGACWELVIRTDEQVATEHGLPPLSGNDDLIVDEVAIKRAMTGEPVRLTRPERAEAVRLLMVKGHTVAVVAGLLRMSCTQVTKLWPDELAGQAVIR